MVYPYQGEDGKKLPAVQPTDSFADIERLCLCNDFVVAVEEDRKNIQLQCFCREKNTTEILLSTKL